jgi:hypothetical protein
MNYTRLLNFILIMLFFASCAVQIKRGPRYYDYSTMSRTERRIHRRVEQFLESCREEKYPVPTSRLSRIDSLVLDRETDQLDIYFNSFFAYVPFRELNVSTIYDEMKSYLGWRYGGYDITLYSRQYPVEQLVPNYYRTDKAKYDLSRMPKDDNRGLPVVMNLSKPWKPGKGLFNRNITLWHSHGWYYEQKLNRWEWQRARLFQAVEDIGPITYTIPYLIPMLENAGATVFVPRERDIQTNEVIVDNDQNNFSGSQYLEYSDQWKTITGNGFAIGDPPYSSGENPFSSGTCRQTQSDETGTARAEWIPEIPVDGRYAVYITYQASDSNATDARYTVFHSGGQTEFSVNQQIGGSTWIYLGHFDFKSGVDPQRGKVTVTNKSAQRTCNVSADAVRFGGGMGNVKRGGEVSNRSRFAEGARYYLRYAGMPDTLVYNLHADSNDYRDDYQSRGEWLNFLHGAPFGPNRNRMATGLGIPIDLSLAFHTDAGISPNDTVIGTLSIYSTLDADSSLFFPDSVSRLANRDFADILQTQIVEDLRQTSDPVWNRRGLWDRMYSEAFRPNVPAALLELLSHQNFLDMQFSHHPAYRFDVSRSIYKAILRFVATQYDQPYVVQPLPVSHMQAEFVDSNIVELRWQQTEDLLEPSAQAKQFIVYTRQEDQGFNNGTLVDTTAVRFENIPAGVITSYMVTAVNEGGESFPSEIVAVCHLDTSTSPVCIVNGFDRIDGPAVIKTREFAGFANFIDEGVPDKIDIGYTGRQFNFTPVSKWSDDDAPGYGASHADFETKIIPGNTFDFIYTHGVAIRATGHGFVSTSDEAVYDGDYNINAYRFVDLILGEEKKSQWPKPFRQLDYEAFPQALQAKLTDYCTEGGNLFISGAYVGTDLLSGQQKDSTNIKFARQTLKLYWRTNFAATTGAIHSVDSLFYQHEDTLYYNHAYHPEIYKVEAPDGIEPFGNVAKTLLRYSENNISAAIGFQGKYNLVIFGFPFEAIKGIQIRDNVMNHILRYLKK